MDRTTIPAGAKYGRLTVKKESFPILTSGGKSERVFECLCDCGKIVLARRVTLTGSGGKSCGCLRLELIKKGLTTHKCSHSKEYTTWQTMKSRCLNVKNNRYSRYGGRGVKVCDRWLHSFENFYADMGDKPYGHTIDRIDNNGNYEPSNCKWVTNKENTRHTSTTKLNHELLPFILEMREEGSRLKVIAELFNVSLSTIHLICKGKTWM